MIGRSAVKLFTPLQSSVSQCRAWTRSGWVSCHELFHKRPSLPAVFICLLTQACLCHEFFILREGREDLFMEIVVSGQIVAGLALA